MRSAFEQPRVPALEVRELPFSPLPVMELRYDAENYGQSAPIPPQDALLISLQLRDSLHHDIWEDGKRYGSRSLMSGTTAVYDLRRSVTAASMQPFHCLNFAFALGPHDDGSDVVGYGFERDRWRRGGLRDPVIHALGTSLLPALDAPERTPRMFVEHVLLALRAHLAHRFAGSPAPGVQCGKLSSWQLRRARAFLEAHLGENVSLSDIAGHCSLSAAHFARSFTRSMGMPPHRFLMMRRVERARELLVNTRLPLSEIAGQCGFADQSHLSKVFRRVLGVTPGSLRTRG